jgi:protocatechuate 3,4-dioxygenase, alpha subunit
MSLITTASQTVGPFVEIGFGALAGNAVAPADAAGEHVTIHGRLVDGDGKSISDGVLEIWQSDAEGRYAHPEGASPTPAAFRGFGRILTDSKGEFQFSTIKPGRVPGPDGTLQAPHLVITVFMRGLLKHLLTRLYFPDESSNSEDAVLNLVPADRRGTLIASAAAGSTSALEWSVVLQGKNETVFFDF